MKGMKGTMGALAVALLVSGCNMSNTAKGGLIGGASLKVADFKGIIDAWK